MYLCTHRRSRDCCRHLRDQGFRVQALGFRALQVRRNKANKAHPQEPETSHESEIGGCYSLLSQRVLGTVMGDTSEIITVIRTIVNPTYYSIPMYRPLSSSFWGLPCRILIHHKQELLMGLWVGPKP